MKTWSFYDQVTGIFAPIAVSATDDRAAEANTPEGHEAIEGRYDPATQKVDVTTGQVVPR